MKELIARLAVTEGNRELDAEMRFRVVGDMTRCNFEEGSWHGECNSPGCGGWIGLYDERKSYPARWQDDERLPHYTTSRDAADTLMPDGWTCEILLWFDNQYGVPAVEVIARKKDAMVEVTAITHGKDAEARARCIAALRARDAGDDHASQE